MRSFDLRHGAEARVCAARCFDSMRFRGDLCVTRAFQVLPQLRVGGEARGCSHVQVLQCTKELTRISVCVCVKRVT